VLEYDESLVVCDPKRTLATGAVDPWEKPRYEAERRKVVEFARREGIPTDRPWAELTRAQQERILHGTGRGFVGAFPFLRSKEEKRYKQYIRVFLRQYQTAQECPACRGARLKPEALTVRVGERPISDAAAMPVDALDRWLGGLELRAPSGRSPPHPRRGARAGALPRRRGARLPHARPRDAHAVGRRGAAHRPGELARRAARRHAVRARRAERGAALARHAAAAGLLRRLRDAGNTVLVVEHDPEAIEVADHMIEIGPGAASRAATSCSPGRSAARRRARSPASTSPARAPVPLPPMRRRLGPRWLALTGAREHNLKGADVRIPLGALTVVTGVSGSGKSTLVHDVLYRALEEKLHGATPPSSTWASAWAPTTRSPGWEAVDDVVLVDQSPIGRTPRSNPVTYVKAWDEVRRLFAEQPLSRQRGYTPGTFSFNSEGGRCEACEGAGHVEVEMVFMADVFVPCDVCGGRRFKADVLEVAVRGRTVHDVLPDDRRRGDPLLPARGEARARRCGSCSRWGSATCGSASRRPRCRAARRSG
jgi:excinuclease ABC subunit A